nr:hypothetical protein [Micromonospora sp. DSM 115978]
VESVAPDDVVARLPTAVLPGEPVRPEPKPAAVAALAKQVAAVLPSLPPGPGTDLLLRRPPRLRGRGPGGARALPVLAELPVRAELPVPAEFGGDQIAAVLAAVDALDGSCLAVQGPPGAGKTYLAGRLIRHLV